MQKLSFKKNLPKLNKIKLNSIVFIDKNVANLSFVKLWLKDFDYVFKLKAGESLKSFNSFEKTANKLINQVPDISRDWTFIAVGGGSVGDFVGFIASVYMRGCNLIHIPSTWLSAIDSSHGGKTALNFKGKKNQIGSFYPAQKTFLVEKLLSSQNNVLLKNSLSEIVKIAIIDGNVWAKKLFLDHNFHSNIFYYLKPAIQAKLKIVNKDLFDKKGIRMTLNLGHTFGHALESLLQIPHGQAVGQGLIFSLNWSYEKKYISKKDYSFYISYLKQACGIIPLYELKKRLLKSKLSEELLRIQFTGDKKILKGKKQFVFCKGLGKVFIKKITEDQFVAEAKRQGWLL